MTLRSGSGNDMKYPAADANMFESFMALVLFAAHPKLEAHLGG